MCLRVFYSVFVRDAATLTLAIFLYQSSLAIHFCCYVNFKFTLTNDGNSLLWHFLVSPLGYFHHFIFAEMFIG